MYYLTELMNKFGQTGDLFGYRIKPVSAETCYIFSLSSTERVGCCSFKTYSRTKWKSFRNGVRQRERDKKKWGKGDGNIWLSKGTWNV